MGFRGLFLGLGLGPQNSGLGPQNSGLGFRGLFLGFWAWPTKFGFGPTKFGLGFSGTISRVLGLAHKIRAWAHKFRVWVFGDYFSGFGLGPQNSGLGPQISVLGFRGLFLGVWLALPYIFRPVFFALSFGLGANVFALGPVLGFNLGFGPCFSGLGPNFRVWVLVRNSRVLAWADIFLGQYSLLRACGDCLSAGPIFRA